MRSEQEYEEEEEEEEEERGGGEKANSLGHGQKREGGFRV